MNNTPDLRPARRTKQDSLRLAGMLKRAAVVIATLGFGFFVGLAARQNGSASISQSPSAPPSNSNATPTQAQSSAPSNGDANNLFNTSGQGNYGFGVNSNQPPVSGSSSS